MPDFSFIVGGEGLCYHKKIVSAGHKVRVTENLLLLSREAEP